MSDGTNLAHLEKSVQDLDHAIDKLNDRLEYFGPRLDGLARKLDGLQRALDGAGQEDGLRMQVRLLDARLLEIEKDIDLLQSDRKKIIWTVISAVIVGAVGLGFLLIRVGLGLGG